MDPTVPKQLRALALQAQEGWVVLEISVSLQWCLCLCFSAQCHQDGLQAIWQDAQAGSQ